MLWIGAIIAIGLLIVVHEGGHYIVARWCKMRVSRFSLGFGPAIWSFHRAGTQFQIAPIPFGGFVQIDGMLIADEVDDDDPYAYPNRPAWQRFVTIFAGPATNYLFAVVLAVGLYTCAGVPSGTSWYVVDQPQAGFDAEGKLQKGDRLVAINDKLVYYRYERKAQKGLLDIIQETKDAPLKVTVLRGGEKMDVMVTPKLDKDSNGKEAYRLGIQLMFQDERVDVGPIRAVGHALWYPFAQTKMIVVGLYKIATKQAEGQLTGPVGITTAIKKHIEVGWIAVIQLLMLLNVYLGLFNLFPLPALDGGRLVFLTYEMATRRRANPKIEATVHMVGIMALLVLMVLVTYKDIARLF